MLLSFILYREQGQLIVSSSQPRCCCSTTWLKTLCSSCRAIPPFFVASFSIKPRIVALLSSFITVDKKKKNTRISKIREIFSSTLSLPFFSFSYFSFFFPLRITHSNRGTVTVCSTFIYLSQNIGSHYGFHFSFRPVKFCHSRVFRSSPIFFFFFFPFFRSFFFFSFFSI